VAGRTFVQTGDAVYYGRRDDPGSQQTTIGFNWIATQDILKALKLPVDLP
jgi:hypothetical protein